MELCGVVHRRSFRRCAGIQELNASRWRLDPLPWFGDYTAKWTFTPDSSGEKEYTRLQLLDISRTLRQNDQLAAHPRREFGFPFPR